MKSHFLLYAAALLALPAVFGLQNQWQIPALAAQVPAAPTPPAPACATAQGLARVVCRAEALKATLTPGQVALVQLPYSKADAAKWSNFPQRFSRPQRVGLSLGALSAPQLAAAKALLAAVLAPGMPNEGYDELEGGLAADDYLGTATKQTDTFGRGNYYLALLGTPSLTGRWELQYGGHHFALANTYAGGKVAGVTPAFRGVEPMTAVAAHGRTYAPMAQEQQAFAALLGSLSSSQAATARLGTAFHDVVLGPGQDGQFPAARQGLRVGSLSAAQQQLVLRALRLYVNDLEPATAAPILAAYTAQLADTYLAFVGSGTMRQASDYVRLDGPRLWLEYSAQASRDFPGTVHPHSVWRDRTSDYGGR
ncbi:DUF3500 domain-containing protein [Hymenobacter cheonanensis]|uniref:DUF3500 domain-containing protein n=1 Tax=Hymenobacter sp. CA2-7 TaxID=3063993 RepID=UPI0027130EA7|nr:DUF3500 domain-containing protein [Hymenobacter sp. CA2-7]MDO7888271.1 DUF3500 domain-containing protein [Hymenobacter sp. CA2-7]